MTIGMQNEINASEPRKNKPVPEPRYGDEGMVEMCVQLPPSLVDAVGHYLDAHPAMSWDDAAIAALALLVIQNGHSTRAVSKQYLESVFGGAA